MSLNFFKHFGKAKIADLEESMVQLAVALDKDGVAEAAILQKSEEHNQRIAMLQEANTEYAREQKEYEQELALYTRYMNEAESIQRLLTDPNRDPQYTETELTSDLNELLNLIEERAPILEKEKREAEQAKSWMNDMQEAVDEISKELMSLRESVNNVKREIAQAEIEKERNRKRAEQAEVLAGLKKSGNKFDVAINALKQQADKDKAEAEQLQIKADSLKVAKPRSTEIIGKYSTPAAPAGAEALSERLARLKK